MAVNWYIPKYRAYLTCQIVIQNKYTLECRTNCPTDLQHSCCYKYTTVHLVPPGLLWDNKSLSRVPMDAYNYVKLNILVAWQTPVSVWALFGWLKFWGCSCLGHSSHGFFLLSPLFQTQQISIGCRTTGADPGGGGGGFGGWSPPPFIFRLYLINMLSIIMKFCLSIIIWSLIIQILIKPPYKHLSKVLSVDLR